MPFYAFVSNYDAKLRQRLKTVELIVERTGWNPPKPSYGENTLVPLLGGVRTKNLWSFGTGTVLVRESKEPCPSLID